MFIMLLAYVVINIATVGELMTFKPVIWTQDKKQTKIM